METKKDYTSDLQALIPESVAMSSDSKGLEDAINSCLVLEKKCRTNNDFTTLKALCLHMVRLCKDKGNWAKLNSVLAVLHKRRAQSKIVVGAIVEEAYSYLNTVNWPTLETKIELIKTLKDICEGKIYVEAESARLHLMLAMILEKEKGDIAAACDMIQDVHVETYGSLTKKEKAEYILEQIRLNLAKKDFIRALIQSRKMNRKVIEESGFEDVKVKFYTMMVEYHSQNKEIWDICQSYYKIYDTKTTKEDPSLAAAALQACVIFLVLSKFDNHQSDMMHRIKALKDIEQMPEFLHALTLFTTKEIISYPFLGIDKLESHAALKAHGGPEMMTYLIKLIHIRVIEHNLRVVSGYYRRITAARLGEMLGLDQETLEQHLSELAASGDFCCKIDRPAGIITFHKARAAEAVLTDWSTDIGKLLSLMESTCHLINRENMVNGL